VLLVFSSENTFGQIEMFVIIIRIIIIIIIIDPKLDHILFF